ncbi:MAG: hypothetical protein HFACDABA_00851 [Anaerolineales bacterium]|nr:hypothetical protein [Anaerolineales bacterium]
MIPFRQRVFLVIFFLLSVLACNLPQVAPPADTIHPSTIVALTVNAAINSQPPPIPSATNPASAVATETLTPIPTLSPTPVFTSTSSVPLVSVSVDTNCRIGPGKVYDRVGGLLVGESVEAIGKDPTNQYYYVRDSEAPGGFCWVWGYYATVIGNASILPVFTPAPSPTPAPDFELSYAGIDSCVGWWAELRLKNTGPVTFRSYSLSIKDRTLDVSLTDFGDGFVDIGGCLTSGIVSELAPGDVYILSSPAFVNNIVNHKMRATVTLCTQVGQGGVCVSQTIDFQP